jgi:deoxyribonuclease IV
MYIVNLNKLICLRKVKKEESFTIKMVVKFGPAGIGPIKDVEKTFKLYKEKGIRAAEIPFTYGIFIKKKEEAEKVGNTAKKFDISLSIHAPYWINLNSKEKKKIEESKKRILDTCEVASWMGAGTVVFHAGFYGKDSKENTYQEIKKSMIEMQEVMKKKKWKVKLAPETMGKINVFGSAEEILKLVKETGCSFCLDFAHLHARSLGKENYKEIYEKFKHFPDLHCHFSGIVFGEKGEKMHKLTPKEEIEKLIRAIPSNKEITIINESPSPVEDSITSLKIFNGLKD